MSGIKDLFPKSPFSNMLEHIDKVSQCIDKLELLFNELKAKNYDKVELLANDIVKLEEEADTIKDMIRKNITKNIMIPVDKGELLAILTAQDGIADVCEDIARLFTLRKMEIPDELQSAYQDLVDAILNSSKKAVAAVRDLGDLFEVGFKGPEVEKVTKIFDELEASEKAADEKGLEFTRKILALEGKESPVAIFMWLRIIKVMGDLANISEKLSNRFRLLLN